MLLAFFACFIFFIGFLGFGLMMAACGVVLVVFGIISIKKPGKIKFLKCKPLSITMIIIGTIVAIIGLMLIVVDILYLGGMLVVFFKYFMG